MNSGSHKPLWAGGSGVLWQYLSVWLKVVFDPRWAVGSPEEGGGLHEEARLEEQKHRAAFPFS